MNLVKYDTTSNLDDPETTIIRKEIIKSKPFLRKIYLEWYNILAANLAPAAKILEIGSGGGFLKEIHPYVVTSDIQDLHCHDLTFSAEKIPFADESLDRIVMLNVFHHITHPKLFLEEAQRTLKKGGKAIMIEPANSFFSRVIYKNFHHEPFDPKGGWEIEHSPGPLSGSNQAMTHIYFERDRKIFEEKFSALKINKINYHTPLLYIISGGFSMRSLSPSWSFGFFRIFEKILSPFSKQLGLFQTIELEKK